jgi:endonuclease/exonuclease/phosphatase family metal-dependent hydrolase
MSTLTVVTLNLLRELERWPERRALVVQGLAEQNADLIALQEVALPEDTAQWLADELGGYQVWLCPKTGVRARREAIAILSRLPVEDQATLDLKTQWRVAHYVRVRVAGRPLVFCNGHYFWKPLESEQRVHQVRRLLDWLGALPAEWPVIAVGDFNGTPGSRALQLMRTRFASAHAAQHGREPEWTCPTPLGYAGWAHWVKSYALSVLANRRLKLWRGTLDYIFVNAPIRVRACRVILDQPAPHDPTLYPSDHLGLAATLEVG